MIKDEINAKLREYAKTLSPTERERNLVSKIYTSINDLLGINNCIQIGSYPRFTSVTPIHDLDILYFLGEWNQGVHDPSRILQNLYEKLRKEYVNPTVYTVKFSLQTHSVTILYSNAAEEVFSVDIVPAYRFSKNEFSEDTYKVPEVIKKQHQFRSKYYDTLSQGNRDMNWITSDPRGYIKIASELDQATNGNFRKTVKIIKVWKNNLKQANKELKLKSFHIEQVITNIFRQNTTLTIFDGIFKFFVQLPQIIDRPNFLADRANSDKFIDDYLEDFGNEHLNKINQARDYLLIRLENLSDDNPLDSLVKIGFYKRVCDAERFLFDSNIPTLLDPNYSFAIYGSVHIRDGSFPAFILDKIGLISVDRKISFAIKGKQPTVDLFKWKVRNADSSDQPRGEITDHSTLNDPEHTKYIGTHYVECYAILNNTCVGKARQDVKLQRP